MVDFANNNLFYCSTHANAAKFFRKSVIVLLTVPSQFLLNESAASTNRKQYFGMLYEVQKPSVIGKKLLGYE